MFSFSTCWNSDASSDGEAMLNEIRELGFKNIELSHGIRVSLLEGIERCLKSDKDLKVTSVHNFCPLPVGYIRSNPNIFLLSSLIESERQRALRQTMLTLDFAKKVGARFIILHLGRVDMFDATGKLIDLIKKGQRDTPKYRKLLEKALERRQQLAPHYVQRVMHSLEIIVKAAAERQLVLCVEFRHELEEIPNETEFDEIFRHFGPENLGYWHDCGHAQTQHNLGIIDQFIWMEKIQDRLVGGHVHDLRYPDRDHQIIGKGMIPFDQLTPLQNPEKLKVFEFAPGTPSDILKESLPPFMSYFEKSYVREEKK
jgi:sugar phosphate isomerase/epimerase